MKIKVNVSTNVVGSDVYDIIEIEDEDLVGLSREEIEKEVDHQAFNHICENMIDWYCEEVE